MNRWLRLPAEQVFWSCWIEKLAGSTAQRACCRWSEGEVLSVQRGARLPQALMKMPLVICRARHHWLFGWLSLLVLSQMVVRNRCSLQRVWFFLHVFALKCSKKSLTAIEYRCIVYMLGGLPGWK